MMEDNYVNGEQSMLLIQRVGMTISVAALATAGALLINSQAFAVSVNNSANTLKVSPVRSDIVIEPGASKTVPSTVTNLTKESITLRPVANDFISGDERGTPALILDDDKYAPTHSLKRMMTPLPDVTIPAGQSKTISVIITVPKNAQAGGYFGAVRFMPTSPDGGGQVNLSASVASLILLTVPGDIVEKLDLTDFTIQQNGAAGSNFRSGKDINASVRFENKGGIQLGPFGKVSVKKGDKVIYEADFNNKDPRDMILPDSARRWDIPLKEVDGFGKYTVTATFTYGQKNQTLEVGRSFWVIPNSAIIAMIVGLLVLTGIGVGLWMYLRSDRRHQSRNHGRRGVRFGR